MVGAGPLWAQQGRTLSFSHTLKDARGDPVGGVFWMHFSLHSAEGEATQVWWEEFPVAVDMGTYQVELGRERPIPHSLPEDLLLVVALDETELLRMPVEGTMWSDTDGVPSWGQKRPGKGPEGACALCEEAREARNSHRLQGMTFQQLETTLARRSIRLGEGIRRVAISQSPQEGLRLLCPPQHVAVGLEIPTPEQPEKAMELLCAPLEFP